MERFIAKRNVRQNPDGGIVIDQRHPNGGAPIIRVFDVLADAEAAAALYNARAAAGAEHPFITQPR